MPQHPEIIDGLSQIAHLYDAFLIDQWGVIHDGQQLTPGAIRTFKELRFQKKTVVVLTNSSKSSDRNVSRLEKIFGVPPDLYTALVSSADILKRCLNDRAASEGNFGKMRLYVVADQGDQSLLEDGPWHQVDDMDLADFVVLLSVPPGDSFQKHERWIECAIHRKLPVYCPSADLMSVTTKGIVSGLSGIVDSLRNRGGIISNFGKPEKIVYDECSRWLSGLQPSRVLAIGDQIGSDILGANRRGYHGALVCTGATAATFPRASTITDFARAASQFGESQLNTPKWVMPQLQWIEEEQS